MTIISSFSLGVCWFDLSLLICQRMLISLVDSRAKAEAAALVGKRGEDEEPRGRQGHHANGHCRGSSKRPRAPQRLRACHCFTKPSKVSKFICVHSRNLSL